MKKLFISILLLVYFTVNTGFVVNLHYCMHKIAGIVLNGEEHDSCGKCGMPVKDKEGCCREEVKVVKLYQDILPAFTIVPQFLAMATLGINSCYFLAPLQQAVLAKANQ